MNIVVTGRRGQIAQALHERADAGHHVIMVARPEFELTRNPDDIHAALAAAQPDVVVSAAAWTAVEDAERAADQAFAVNAAGAGAVADAARRIGVPLIHISTDYVFDGHQAAPYVEHDRPNPQSVYGASKLAGEKAVRGAHDDSVVLRTAWLFSPFGRNFVRTMLELAKTREEVDVVDDQFGNPTSAAVLADAIIAIAIRLRNDRDPALRGIFHLASPDAASWAELAGAVFDASAALHAPSARVRPVGSADFPAIARRPANSRLDCGLIERRYAIRLAPWRDAVPGVVARAIGASGRVGA